MKALTVVAVLTLCCVCTMALNSTENSDKRVIRKEWRRMSKKMKKTFIRHFNNLSKRRANEAKSRLHMLADWITRTSSPGSHRGPASLPWHREYLFRLVVNALIQLYLEDQIEGCFRNFV